jgi:hypothetical protein
VVVARLRELGKTKRYWSEGIHFWLWKMNKF